MLRAVFYARVSTQEEAQLKALPKQVEECRDCIKAKGWELISEYVDEGKSGTEVKGRDEYQRLYDDMDQGKFDIIVIKSQDRLQRNTKDWYVFIDRLVTNGLRLYMYLENSFYTADNALITGIKAILAEEYSRDLSKKLNNSNKRRIERAMRGEEFSAMGTTMLYGFTIKDCRYVVVPEQAEVVRIAYQKYLELDSVIKVRDYLNTHGYVNQSGKPFCTDSITRMLKNEHYKGTYVLNRYHRDFDRKKVVKKSSDEWVVIDHAHEAIIDATTWDKVYKRLTSKHTESGRGKKTGSDILSGKLFCSCCGRVMWRHSSNGYFNWYCSASYSRGIGCESPVAITTVAIRKAFRNILRGLNDLGIDVDRDYIKRCILADLQARRDLASKGKDTSEEERELERLERKKERLTEAFLDEIISKADYKEKYAELESKIKRLENTIRNVVQCEEVELIDAYIASVDEELDKWIASSGLDDVRIDFLIAHSKRIEVQQNKRITVDIDPLAGLLITAGTESTDVNAYSYDSEKDPEGYTQRLLEGSKLFSVSNEKYAAARWQSS